MFLSLQPGQAGLYLKEEGGACSQGFECCQSSQHEASLAYISNFQSPNNEPFSGEKDPLESEWEACDPQRVN